MIFIENLTPAHADILLYLKNHPGSSFTAIKRAIPGAVETLGITLVGLELEGVIAVDRTASPLCSVTDFASADQIINLFYQ